MDIRWMESFVAVAEARSFSMGAERLYMTQSAVSKDIKKLETELDIQLFDRSHRQVELTPSGELLLPKAKLLLSQYHSVLQIVREERPLRIAMLPVADSYGFPQLLSAYSAENPGTVLRLEEHQNAAIMQMREDDRVDGIFCRIFEPYRPESHAVLFRRDRLVLLVRDEGQQDTDVNLADYRNHRFIFLQRNTGFWESSMSLCLDAGFSPDICYIGSSRANIVRLVQEGAGVALLAESVAAECRQDGLRLLYLTRSVESCLVFACTERGRKLEGMKKLIAYLKEHAQ